MVRFPRLAALVAAVSLAVALPGAAFAADVTEALNVNSALTVTGVPASIDYGSVDPGQSTAQKQVAVTVTSNSAWALNITGTDFNGSGGRSINKSARQLTLAQGSGTSTVNVGPGTTFNDPALNGAPAEATGPAGTADLIAQLRINVPGSAPAGAYTGTVSFVASAN